MRLTDMNLFGPDNPILIDNREGSKALIPLLEARHLPVLSTKLEYGDLSWTGNGPHGACSVGIEYKSTKDILQCMTSERYSGHQLPGMIRNYDVVILLIYGVTREESQSGILQELVMWNHKPTWVDASVGQTRFKYSQLDGYLATISTCARVEVLRVSYEPDAVAVLASRYRWWTRKEWAEHGSHKAIYTPPPPTALFMAPTLCRRVANQLPGIGWEKSLAVEQKFKTTLNLAAAGVKEWMEIQGIGKTIAQKVVKAIQEGEDK